MDAIVGGAWQGKLDYAKKTFAIAEDDLCVCTPDREPDFTKRCLVHYEAYLLRCLRQGRDASHAALREDAVVLAEDIFCGVVSVDEETRAWREAAGRGLTALALRADTVTRLFCGLPLRLKG